MEVIKMTLPKLQESDIEFMLNTGESKSIDEMTNFKTGAVRDTGGKGRMDLLPMCALIRVSHRMEDALTHYPERNWEIGLPMHTMINSAFRHLAKYMDGQTDEDHLCAATTNLLMAMWTEEKRPDLMNIPSRKCNNMTDYSKEVSLIGK